MSIFCFVIHVCHPSFDSKGIKKYLSWVGPETGKVGRCLLTMPHGTQAGNVGPCPINRMLEGWDGIRWPEEQRQKRWDKVCWLCPARKTDASTGIVTGKQYQNTYTGRSRGSAAFAAAIALPLYVDPNFSQWTELMVFNLYYYMSIYWPCIPRKSPRKPDAQTKICGRFWAVTPNVAVCFYPYSRYPTR